MPDLILLAQDDTKEVYFESADIIKITDIIEEHIGSFKIISPIEYQLKMQKTQEVLEERLKAMGDRNTRTDVKFGKNKSLELAD